MSRVDVIRCANFCRRTSSASFSAVVSGGGGLVKPKSVSGLVAMRNLPPSRFVTLYYDGKNQVSDSLFVRLVVDFGVRFDAGCLSRLISSRRSRIRFSTPSFVGR